jgi:hypothetical protein
LAQTHKAATMWALRFIGKSEIKYGPICMGPIFQQFMMKVCLHCINVQDNKHAYYVRSHAHY